MIVPDDVHEWLVSSVGATLPAPTDEDEALLVRVIEAVEAHVAHTHLVPVPVAPDTDRPADFDQAIIMAAARLWDRRNTPNGIGGFGEFGSVRVTSIDPDVTSLLAPYRRWCFA